MLLESELRDLRSRSMALAEALAAVSGLGGAESCDLDQVARLSAANLQALEEKRQGFDDVLMVSTYDIL